MAKYHRLFPDGPLRPIVCVTCGTTALRDARGRPKYCSPECKPQRRWQKSRKSIPQSHRRVILKRDGWICYLCSLPIPPELRWPHPLSGTIDHVIPVSAGGSDRDENLRAAHWHCNTEKGDRLPGIEVWVPREALV